MNVGDTLRFKLKSCRYPVERGVVSRKINGFYGDRPTVRFAGCSDFIIRPDEIVEVIPKEES